MASEPKPLHILFFPLMAAGHMQPLAKMATLFAAHGVKATILTTPANAPLLHLPPPPNPLLSLSLLPFPSAAAGLPDGCENVASLPSPSLIPNFLTAVSMLSVPFSHLLTSLRPDAVVSDFFLPWTQDIAAEHGIPRLMFNGTSFFAVCANDCLVRAADVASSSPFVLLPGLPHRIRMLKSQIPDPDPAFVDAIKRAKDGLGSSYGVVMNTFYELEPDYADHYRHVIGRKAWHVGPVSLCDKQNADVSTDSEACLGWLDGNAPGSVVYVCFGSLGDLSTCQLREIAIGLEASGRPFIWVVRNNGQDWLPEGYEERIKGRGRIIKGWAPQVLILNHKATGSFVTHCGWNSSLEGVSAGVPLVTWPLFADQFFNERLIVDVLGIGVAVGSKDHVYVPEARPVIVAAVVEKVVGELMGGGEAAEERRRKASELGETARRAVEEGGSSYRDMGNLIQELMDRRTATTLVTNLL